MSLVDTHIHVFVRGLPLAPVRRYVPEYDATYEDYLRHAQPSGVTHAVIVQPSFLGIDNSYMSISEDELDALQADGVVGIRLNLDGLPIPTLDQGPWPTLLASLKRRRWQVEVHRVGRDLPAFVPALLEAGVDVVLDHFGRPDDDLGADDPAFRALLGWGASRHLWVKLSGAYRNGSEGRGFANAPAQTRLLLEHLGADRLVWGSDWPHTRHESVISVERMRQCLEDWVPSRAQREAIMGQTALELFRF